MSTTSPTPDDDIETNPADGNPALAQASRLASTTPTPTQASPAEPLSAPSTNSSPADAISSERLFLYSTTVSDVGTVRSNNQDSSFAGERLVSVCDGMGGHAGGDTASTIAIRGLAHIEQSPETSSVETIASMMETSVLAAHDAIVGKAKRERALAGMGTTVTAVTLAAGHWVCTHIGDSRAYLLRNGHLQRMTQDHSYVQHLIETGRITESEARNHPQRNVVMRVLGDFDIDPHPDVAIFKARPADRWLLCSDGLCGVLEDTTIEDVMIAIADPEECAQRLVSMALKAGSTDNVTAVIADATLALDANSFDLPHQTPLIGGAASSNLEAIADIVKEPVASAPALRLGKTSPAQRAAALRRGEPVNSDRTDQNADAGQDGSYGDEAAGHIGSANDGTNQDADGISTHNRNTRQPSSNTGNTAADTPEADADDHLGQHIAQPSSVREETGEKIDMDTGEIPVVRKRDGRLTADPNDPDVIRAIRREQHHARQEGRRRRNRIRLYGALAVIVLIAAVAAGSVGAWKWSQTKYFLGESDGVVAIYQGVNTNIFGLSLSHKVEDTSVKVTQLPQSWSEQLDDGISADSLADAHSRVNYIKREIKTLKVHKDENGKTVQTPDTADSSNKPSSDKSNSSSKSNSAKPGTSKAVRL